MNKIESEIISNIENFKRIVGESNGIGEICRRYNFSDNGKSRKQIKSKLNEFKLDISHFGLKNHPRKYQPIQKECPVCKSPFQALKGHTKEAKTCSHKCANQFFAKPLSLDQKEKIRNGIQKYLLSINKTYLFEIKIKKTCEMCRGEFFSQKKLQRFCSNKCSYNSRSNNIEYCKKLSESAKQRVLNGTHKGWNSRKIISYPEQFFMEVLFNNNISYEHNKKIGKYFIDFAITEKMIALEIDGKQHQYEERKKSDEMKDEFLTENGWKVYRIPWKSINNKEGSLYIKSEIYKFIEYFNNGHVM